MPYLLPFILAVLGCSTASPLPHLPNKQLEIPAVVDLGRIPFGEQAAKHFRLGGGDWVVRESPLPFLVEGGIKNRYSETLTVSLPQGTASGSYSGVSKIETNDGKESLILLRAVVLPPVRISGAPIRLRSLSALNGYRIGSLVIDSIKYPNDYDFKISIKSDLPIILEHNEIAGRIDCIFLLDDSLIVEELLPNGAVGEVFIEISSIAGEWTMKTPLVLVGGI